MKYKKVLITGGNGFLGKHLAELLESNNYEVKSLSSQDVDLTLPLKKDIFAKVDAIVHLAADSDVKTSLQEPGQNILKNTSMLIHVLESIRVSGKIIPVLFASSDRIYGKNLEAIMDESASTYPIEPYSASKMIGEVILESYKHLYNIPYIAFRIDSIYGPGQPERMFISSIIGKMLKGNKISVGDLSVHKNFVYVTDVADAFLKGLEADSRAWNTCYNVGGIHLPLSHIADIVKAQIEKKLNKKIEFVFDQDLIRTKGSEVNPFALDTSKVKQALGWSPKISLEEGLKKMVDSFINNYEK